MAQIGTIRVETQNNGTVALPVFALGDGGSSIYEIWRVETAGGTGFVPLGNPNDVDHPYIRVQTQNHNTLAVHSQASIKPDSGNLTAHWAARLLSGYSDGNTVSPFTDDTGNYDATVIDGSPTYSTNEINGQPAVTYDGTSDLHDSGIQWNISDSRSVYIVMYVPSTGESYQYGTDTAERTYISAQPADDWYVHAYGDSFQTPGSPPGDTWFIVSQTDGSGSSTLYENNTSVNTLSYSTVTNQITDYIGGRNKNDGTVNYSDCRIAEIMLYQNKHGSSTRQDVWDYLNEKYAIF